MTINNDLLDQLLKDYQKPEDILGENGLLKQLTKAVLERALQAELTHHLGYDKHSPSGQNSDNSRNGKSKKTLKGDFGALPLEVPRDRNSSFEPHIVSKISSNQNLAACGGVEFCLTAQVIVAKIPASIRLVNLSKENCRAV